MEIKIDQKTISLTEEYKIYINDTLKYIATSEPLKKAAKIDILDVENNECIIKIAKQNFGLRANYYIQPQCTKEIFSFEEINNIKLLLRCQINDDLYQFYGHNGNRYSIFKNQKQIGFWEKNNFIFGESDFYKIITNDNENPLFLASFCLCIDNAKNNFQNEMSIFNFDIGYKGNMLRKFDTEWKPNQ